jgi:hypothetical protein
MHKLDLVREHEGTEEWLCPNCGRHMLVNWTPRFKRTILEYGDMSVGHTAFKNNIQVEDIVDAQVNGTLPDVDVMEPVDESRLIPWNSWMDKSNYSDLWNVSD